MKKELTEELLFKKFENKKDLEVFLKSFFSFQQDKIYKQCILNESFLEIIWSMYQILLNESSNSGKKDINGICLKVKGQQYFTQTNIVELTGLDVISKYLISFFIEFFCVFHFYRDVNHFVSRTNHLEKYWDFVVGCIERNSIVKKYLVYYGKARRRFSFFINKETNEIISQEEFNLLEEDLEKELNDVYLEKSCFWEMGSVDILGCGFSHSSFLCLDEIDEEKSKEHMLIPSRTDEFEAAFVLKFSR